MLCIVWYQRRSNGVNYANCSDAPAKDFASRSTKSVGNQKERLKKNEESKALCLLTQRLRFYFSLVSFIDVHMI